MYKASKSRPDAQVLLAKLQESQHARLRVYIGAAPGVGKTYQMLEDAHLLKRQGFDVAIGLVETYGRADTEVKIGDLEIIPKKQIEYRGVTIEEMDLEAILERKPEICLVDELAHTNAPGSKNLKRYEDVVDLLDAGIHVMTAVNVQHLETLNDAVARSSGVRVRETIPDSFLQRADEVVNVDVTIDELRTRIKQGKVYKPEKIEQSLANFFRKGNLSTLRELALRAVADDVASKSAQYRSREGLEPAPIPEKVMVCISSQAPAKKLIRAGARIAGRLGAVWYAVYVETPNAASSTINPEVTRQLEENLAFAEALGATVVKLKARRAADGLIAFANREGITHVIFGQSARSRWEILFGGSVLNRFLAEVKNAAVQIIPAD
jgi:two-component system sensor histidine kinase KdpD